ncbi:cell division protein SepF [Raoultibacter phocaeensis]|uniref:cell division protein SepF n=1 Tax=Raoultibacter phocaeensis TaxID=2479841 RepID=UPI00210503ED|nr:cell division protein SepF [Raoultibacter phocaeensis]
MFDGIKSKLGFGDANAAADDGYYDEYADEYGEGYEEEYGEYGESYDDEYAYSDRGSRSSRSGGYSSSSPNLVSIDDVRANTQIPDSLKRDPLPPRHASSASTSYAAGSSSYSPGSGYRSSFGSRQVERAADYLRSTETSDLPNGAQHAAEARSEGLNSLFTSTSASTSTASGSAGSSSSYDPYEAYAGTGTATHNPTRSLTVLKPASYGEVERVAKIVKAGDVVVLSLRNTPDHLAKRILDFSFGVSSALDASVECIADKVFVILRGSALTADELSGLRNQGVL